MNTLPPPLSPPSLPPELQQYSAPPSAGGAWWLWILALVGGVALVIWELAAQNGVNFPVVLVVVEALFIAASVNLGRKLAARRSNPNKLGIALGLTVALFASGHAMVVALTFVGCLIAISGGSMH